MFKMSFLELPSGLGEGGRKVIANCGDLQFGNLVGGREAQAWTGLDNRKTLQYFLLHSYLFRIWGGVLNTPPLGGWYV